MMSGQRVIPLRLTQEEYDSVRFKALIEQTSMAEIVRRAIAQEFEREGFDVASMKQLVAAARSRGPVPKAEVLRMARRVAELDDQEGLGPITVIRKVGKSAAQAAVGHRVR
jgi:hypothetical protein